MTTNRRGIDPAIIAAIIGVMGTLCVTIISLYANRLFPQPSPQPSLQPQPTVVEPTWTASPTVTLTNTSVPTSTVPAGDPTSTPAPDTPTSEATFTSVPPAIGSDWANDCVSVLWRPVPETTPPIANGSCLSEPVANVFYAEAGRLQFLVVDRAEEVQGMFAPLTANGTARVSAFLKTLQGGEIWMGVFAEPRLDSQGTIIVIPSGEANISKRVPVQKTMPGEIEVSQEISIPSQNPPIYDVEFTFGNNEVSTKIEGESVVLPAVPVNSGQQWLFVGYKVTRQNNYIDAEFLSLSVQPQ